MTLRVLAALLLAALCIGAATAAPASARSCGSIAFTPNSDEGAGDIRARGVRCRVARRVARASRSHGPSGEAGTIFRYRARRFRCRGRELDTPLPSVRYRCMRGRSVVRFVKT